MQDSMSKLSSLGGDLYVITSVTSPNNLSHNLITHFGDGILFSLISLSGFLFSVGLVRAGLLIFIILSEKDPPLGGSFSL